MHALRNIAAGIAIRRHCDARTRSDTDADEPIS